MSSYNSSPFFYIPCEHMSTKWWGKLNWKLLLYKAKWKNDVNTYKIMQANIQPGLTCTTHYDIFINHLTYMNFLSMEFIRVALNLYTRNSNLISQVLSRPTLTKLNIYFVHAWCLVLPTTKFMRIYHLWVALHFSFFNGFVSFKHLWVLLWVLIIRIQKIHMRW